MTRRLALRSTVVASLLAVTIGVPPATAGTTAGSIGGTVFQDVDRDSILDAGEPALAGRQMLLFEGAGGFVASVNTNSLGRYVFSGLAVGAYTVEMSTPSWWELRDDWVPTTTGTLFPRISLDLTGSTIANFGWRQIVRSTTLGAPISSYTGSNGLTVESYDDVVTAVELYDAVSSGLVGEEASHVIVRFDYGTNSSTVASVLGTPGSYSNYQAVSYMNYASWLDGGDVGLAHEYGHAWSLFYGYIAQQDSTLTSYLEARGLAGDPRVNSSYMWSAREMIAEDYRQLLGSPTARAAPQMNREIPPAAEVPGLAEFLAGPFTQAVAPPPPPPPPTLSVSTPAVAPSPVTKQASITFTLSVPATVTVTIRNSSGGLVRTLLSSASKPDGPLSVTWNRKDQSGRRVKAGQYVVGVSASAPGDQQASTSTSFAVA